MKRTAVNPWDWGLPFHMNQGELLEGVTRQLRCSGQVAVKPDPTSEYGFSVIGADDLREQMRVALANVDAVLTEAGMERSDIVHLTMFTTDPDGVLANWDVYVEWVSAAGIMPTQSMIGVKRLVLPELMIEIEATAAT